MHLAAACALPCALLQAIITNNGSDPNRKVGLPGDPAGLRLAMLCVLLTPPPPDSS